VKNLKLVFVLAIVAGFISVNTGCSKSNNNNPPATKDSVLYSGWMPLTASFSSTDSAFEDNITAAHITQAIVDHGSVLCYYKDNLGEVAPARDLGLLSFVTVGNILLVAGGDFTTPNLVFRYVIIPGTVAVSGNANGVVSGTARSLNVTGLKAMSYEQVTKALNIPAEGGNVK
jgi:hypothetical protein